MSQARSGDLRGLKALVAGLGMAVVVGTAVVIGVVIKRIYASPAPPSNISAATPVPGEAANLPPGSKITGIAAAGGVFAVTVSGPAGEQVWIVNPAGGRFLALAAPK